jgi:hypothetical protein
MLVPVIIADASEASSSTAPHQVLDLPDLA